MMEIKCLLSRYLFQENRVLRVAALTIVIIFLKQIIIMHCIKLHKEKMVFRVLTGSIQGLCSDVKGFISHLSLGVSEEYCNKRGKSIKRYLVTEL
jgi:hypothetical protein